jgi:hypothetical protein
MDKMIFTVSFTEDGDIRNVNIEAQDSGEMTDFSVEDVATALELMYDQVSDHINNMYEEEGIFNRDIISITC